MILDDISHLSANYKLSRILNVLQNVHGIEINFAEDVDYDDLQKVYETYADLKRSIIEGAMMNFQANTDYSKSILIMEAIRIYLAEVYPKKRKRNKQG